MLSVAAVIVVARYFIKQNASKDALLQSGQTKHEASLQEQIVRSEKRLDETTDKFDVALERRDAISRETARAVELVGDRMRDLAEEIRSKR